MRPVVRIRSGALQDPRRLVEDDAAIATLGENAVDCGHMEVELDVLRAWYNLER
jgi:hypothetical protein